MCLLVTEPTRNPGTVRLLLLSCTLESTPVLTPRAFTGTQAGSPNSSHEPQAPGVSMRVLSKVGISVQRLEMVARKLFYLFVFRFIYLYV